jgi:hypothetical protein
MYIGNKSMKWIGRETKKIDTHNKCLNEKVKCACKVSRIILGDFFAIKLVYISIEFQVQ